MRKNKQYIDNLLGLPIVEHHEDNLYCVKGDRHLFTRKELVRDIQLQLYIKIRQEIADNFHQYPTNLDGSK